MKYQRTRAEYTYGWIYDDLINGYVYYYYYLLKIKRLFSHNI